MDIYNTKSDVVHLVFVEFNDVPLFKRNFTVEVTPPTTNW